MDGLNMNPNGNKKNSVCRYFAGNGFCLYGDECQFIHSPQRPASNAPPIDVHHHQSLSNLPPESKLQSYMHTNSTNTSTNAPATIVNSFYNHDNSLSSHMSSLAIDSVGNNRLTPLNTNSNTPNHNSSSMGPNPSEIIASNFFVNDDIRAEITRKLSLCLEPPNPELYPTIPVQIDCYHEMMPLESPIAAVSTTLSHGLLTSVYRATNINDGSLVCVRRLHAFQPNTANAKSLANAIDQWKRLSHPNIVQLKHVFTTKAFDDNSLIFVYHYYEGSETLMHHYFSHTSSLGNSTAMNGYATSSRPYSQQQHQRKYLPETLLWNYIIQLSSAIRAIHMLGLACRALDPTKIIMTSGTATAAHAQHSLPSHQYPRLRLSCSGVFDVITHEAFLLKSSHSNPKVLIAHFQQEDLTAFGKICLALACNSLNGIVSNDNGGNGLTAAIEHIPRHYSPDLSKLIMYLLKSSATRSINDIMPMIGARFYTQLDNLYIRDDILIGELTKEIDNGRVMRLLTKLGSINERPEFQMDPNWSETGDRYLLKLFRDYLFHQVNDEGRPWLDLGHIVGTLNKLDMGTPEKICLISRDEQNILIVSFAELKRCFESSLNELL